MVLPQEADQVRSVREKVDHAVLGLRLDVAAQMLWELTTGVALISLRKPFIVRIVYQSALISQGMGEMSSPSGRG